jgi:hypothetical protein
MPSFAPVAAVDAELHWRIGGGDLVFCSRKSCAFSGVLAFSADRTFGGVFHDVAFRKCFSAALKSFFYCYRSHSHEPNHLLMLSSVQSSGEWFIVQPNKNVVILRDAPFAFRRTSTHTFCRCFSGDPSSISGFWSPVNTVHNLNSTRVHKPDLVG